MPGFLSYVTQEILPEGRKGAGSAADEEKGLSSRESVYNTLLFVPLQVERLLTFGNLMCLDAFLGIFTLLPLRLISSAAQFLLLGGVGNPAHCARDLCWALQLGATVAFLLHFVHISEIYHYIHGQVQEVIKLYGFMTMLDIFDKILLNLHSDCLEALSASCTGVVESVQARKGLQARARGSVRLGLDLLAGTAVLMAHTFILICEAIAFSVAVTSGSTNLVAILLTNNFNEIKSTVFKNITVTKVWRMTVQDIVERFHVACALTFVVIHSMLLKGTFVPKWSLVTKCLYIIGIEMAVDIVKHAFAGKFNDVKPGIYSEYMRDLCIKATEEKSYNLHRPIGFVPLVPAALILRLAVPFWSKARKAAVASFGEDNVEFWLLVAGFYVAMLAAKLVLGWGLKRCAAYYVAYYTGAGRRALARSWILGGKMAHGGSRSKID